MQRQLGHLRPNMGVRRQSEMDELRGRFDRLERPDRDWENSRRSAEVDWVGLAIAPHILSIPADQTILTGLTYGGPKTRFLRQYLSKK